MEKDTEEFIASMRKAVEKADWERDNRTDIKLDESPMGRIARAMELAQIDAMRMMIYSIDSKDKPKPEPKVQTPEEMERVKELFKDVTLDFQAIEMYAQGYSKGEIQQMQERRALKEKE